MEVIRAENLTIGYEDKVVAGGIDFALQEGDFLCIIGENGSGKSTLVKTLLRLQEPLGGQISFGDGIGQTEMGYLPQQTDIQKDFPASVKEVVLSGCQSKCGWRPFYNRGEKELAEKNMKRMGIDGYSQRCYGELSGGQQQRVLLARALCAADRILFLDEPVTGLDPLATGEMYELIRGLNEDGMTILMVSHDVDASLKYATHVLHVGKKTFFGTKEEYFSEHGASPMKEGGDGI